MKPVFSLCFFLSLIACTHKKEAAADSIVRFDPVRWKVKEGNAYPYREAMVDHLRDSINVKNIPFDSLMKLLGPPDRVNEGHLYYDIYKAGVGAVTFGTQAFVIKLKADSTVEWRKTYGR